MIYAQYCRLHVHVAASARTVVRAAHRLIAEPNRRNAGKRDARHQWLRAILAEHNEARALCRKFRV